VVPAPVQGRQFARQVLDMHARPPIDMGRILIGQDGDSHGIGSTAGLVACRTSGT